jgi:hypothetical protein
MIWVYCRYTADDLYEKSGEPIVVILFVSKTIFQLRHERKECNPDPGHFETEQWKF